MLENSVVSHFWVAAPPFCSSTILVSSTALESATSRILAQCAVYDLAGALVRDLEVEFPANEVGVLELEPFLIGLKTQSGLAHGHVVIRSSEGTRHFCRQQVGDHTDLISSPKLFKSREMAFVPLLLGAGRAHLLTLVNTDSSAGQVVVRLLYSNRSPEFTIDLPAKGSRVVSLEDELLSTFDDHSWRKGVMQGYVRISPRVQSSVLFQVIEQYPGEGENQVKYRTLLSW
jgi:hypothetical protein